jgi:EmrB/QacA subfamily drug resistance transporter
MSPRRRLIITIALMINTFLASLDVTVVGTAMPTIVAELGGLSLYGWVFSGYLLTSTMTVPIYGKLADRLGRRPAYILAAAIFLGASVLCAQATTMEMLIAGRMVQGIGGGGLLPIAMTILGDLYEPEQRARVQGVIALVWGISSIVGPGVGAFILEVASWPWIFFVNLPVGGLAAAIMAVSLREDVKPTDKKVDIPGALVITVAIVALLVGLQGFESGPSLWGAGLLVVAAVSVFVFVRIERHAEDPVIPLDLFRDPPIAVGVVAALLHAGVLFSIIAYTPLVVRGVLGRDAIAIGAALIPLSLAWSAGSFLGGRVFMRLGYRTAVRAGGAFVLLGVVGYAVTTVEGWAWALVPASATTGIGFGLAFPTLSVVAQERVSWERRGAVTALLQFARNVGGGVFVTALGLVLTSSLLGRLGEQTDPETLSLVLDPDQWGRLAEDFRVQARAALRVSVRAVLIGSSLLALGAGLVLWRFPDVRPGDRPDDPAGETKG